MSKLKLAFHTAPKHSGQFLLFLDVYMEKIEKINSFNPDFLLIKGPSIWLAKNILSHKAMLSWFCV